MAVHTRTLPTASRAAACGGGIRGVMASPLCRRGDTAKSERLEWAPRHAALPVEIEQVVWDRRLAFGASPSPRSPVSAAPRGYRRRPVKAGAASHLQRALRVEQTYQLWMVDLAYLSL